MKPGSALEVEALALIRAGGLPEPTQQHPLGREIGRRWTMDFAWPEHRVALEVDGGGIIHRRVRGRVVAVPGRHNSDEGREDDAVRDAYALLTGWRVFRATPRLLRQGYAVRWLAAAIAQRAGAGFVFDTDAFPAPATLRPKQHAAKLAKARARRADARRG